jgi:hypothetical protein
VFREIGGGAFDATQLTDRRMPLSEGGTLHSTAVTQGTKVGPFVFAI